MLQQLKFITPYFPVCTNTNSAKREVAKHAADEGNQIKQEVHKKIRTELTFFFSCRFGNIAQGTR